EGLICLSLIWVANAKRICHKHSDVLHQLPTKARSTAKGIDPQNDLTCLRIRSKKHKIMITPVNISVRTVELCT
uniref:Roadblock/LAMTOR2 domain-containing protein n=1 Tax=Zonotrichia albicollis TaxID=44394 RepID=A0A8D2N6V7_ZONAL